MAEESAGLVVRTRCEMDDAAHTFQIRLRMLRAGEGRLVLSFGFAPRHRYSCAQDRGRIGPLLRSYFLAC
jgi:hypothetical protein